jgi:hypothetical protein
LHLDFPVIFDSENSFLITFRARPPAPSGIPPRTALGFAPRARSPQFLVAWEGKYADWWGSLKTVLTRVRLHPWRESIDLFRDTPVAPFRFAAGSLGLALLLHFVAILVLPFLLAYSPSSEFVADAAYEEPQRIYYYDVPKHDPYEKLPRITPAGQGGQPGAGQLQALLQKIGSTTTAKRIVIVSKPVRPDNNRQTIYQPATPPDLHIDMELKLPNIVGGPSAAVPKPQVHFNPNNSKPMQAHRTATKATAPTLSAMNAAVPTSLPPATVAQPHLAVPLNESRPMQAQVVIGQVSAPSLSSSNVATAANLGDSYRNGQPAAPAAPSSDADSGNGKGSKDVVQTAGDGSGVVVIGVDPAEAAALVNLPPGNRWGDFTIAPGGGQPGAVGGSEHGMPGAGSHLSGAGGDRVPGVGPGFAGGGGGNSGSSGSVSITGATGDKGEGMLDATIIRDMVFPVPSTVVLRKNALVVSAGPMGGGGLDAYGALHCGKIYTVFLAMPGKSWTLQFCQSGGSAAKQQAQSQSSVIHMEQGLLPPDAEARFDFRRVPVPFEKKNKPIVLKGVIKDDGTVGDLSVYQGIVPQMDEAARVAFSHFKFKPAMKEGKPVAVDILVGIPTEVPATHSQ